MNSDAYRIEYDKWGHLITKAQLIIASLVCLVEIVNNILLYVTRSQGYGPDTILEKLFRYLFLTSFINFGLVVISFIVDKKIKDQNVKKYFLMVLTILICSDVAFSHYQFSITFAIFVLPIMISLLYEDKKLSLVTLILSMCGVFVAIVARAVDETYGKDIGPEAAISVSLIISIFIFAKIIGNTLEQRRNSVKEAIIQTEKAKTESEKMAFSMKMLETLAGTIDAKDKYTNGHSFRVSVYSTKLAEKIGWNQEQITLLKYEALLHDIGKIGVPDVILNKPSRLTDMEFELIKSHSVVGADILKNMVAVPKAADVARYHHERYDGKGYPDKISGKNIPYDARIVCIADSYDAMSSDRIYRKALSKAVIRGELVKGRGTQFDPFLLDAFLELFDEGALDSVASTSISEVDESQAVALTDIKNILLRYNDASTQKESLDDFDKIYQYMKNIGVRYNHSVEVLEITIDTIDSKELHITENEAAEFLQIVIDKNIRAVDVYQRLSARKHMIILLDAGIDNIDIVKNRIKFEYASGIVSNEYRLSIKLIDFVDSPQKKNG